MGEEADALYGLVEQGIEECENYFRDRRLEPKPVKTALAKQRFEADKVMTPEEYASMGIEGWHYVCKDFDGFGNIGIKYVAQR